MRPKIYGFIAIIIIFIPLKSAWAQTYMSPDRPGIGNGSYVIPFQKTYVESGIEYYNAESNSQVSLGQILVRHGLYPGVELRVLLNSFVVENTAGLRNTGITDPGVGIKASLINDPEHSFRLSGLAEVSAPLGESSFSNDAWVPTVGLLADYGLSPFWSLSSNVTYTAGTGSLDRVWMLSLTPGYSLPIAEVGLYAGYAGFYSAAADEHFAEAGITKHLAPYLQLDLNGGVDMASGNFFVGGGAAVRF